jgi:hypothetical protein
MRSSLKGEKEIEGMGNSLSQKAKLHLWPIAMASGNF